MKRLFAQRGARDRITTDTPAIDPDEVEGADATNAVGQSGHDYGPARSASDGRWRRIVAYTVLPGVALALAVGAGYLRWLAGSDQIELTAREESVRAATDGTIAMLSYEPATVEQDLAAARNRLTGSFKDSYASLINEVVVPGAKQKYISAKATVPAAASVSAGRDHAEVLVFVNQTVIMGTDPPTDTASRVRVTLDKVDGQWLIDGFEPI